MGFVKAGNKTFTKKKWFSGKEVVSIENVFIV